MSLLFVFSNNFIFNYPYTPPEKLSWNLKMDPLEKEQHLHTTNFRVPAVSLRSPSAKVQWGVLFCGSEGVWFCMNMKGTNGWKTMLLVVIQIDFR